MVKKLNLLRDLLHKMADFVTDFLDLIGKFKTLFAGEDVENVAEVAEEVEEVNGDN